MERSEYIILVQTTSTHAKRMIIERGLVRPCHALFFPSSSNPIRRLLTFLSCLKQSLRWIKSSGSAMMHELRGHIGRNQTSRSSSHPGHILSYFIMQIKELIYASHYTWPSRAHRYKCKLGTIIHRLRIKSLAQPKTKPTSQQPCQDLEGFK
jgi:hypothetical protein